MNIPAARLPILGLGLLLISGLLAQAAAQSPRDELSREQRAELYRVTEQLRTEGAAPSEIRQAHDDLFSQWGIAVPERGPRGPFADLSDGQRAELRASADRMRAEGATRSEIREAHRRLLADWGVERPEPGEGRLRGPRGRRGAGPGPDEAPRPRFDPGPGAPGFGPGAEAILQDLSREQRAEFHRTTQDLLAEGANRDEIRDAHGRLFEAWGIDRPEPGEGRLRGPRGRRGAGPCGAGPGPDEAPRPRFGRGPGFGPGFGPGPEAILGDLSREQRAEFHRTTQDLLAEGASRDEIRDAHGRLFEAWDIERPAGCRLDEGEDPGAALGEARGTTRSLSGPIHLLGNTPNPFNPSTVIQYELVEALPVRLVIHDLTGRRVRVLVDGERGAGRHNEAWNGKDAEGREVASGTYLYRLEAGGAVRTGRMTLLR
jgi:hypothetical protein